ncbi:MAG: PQQ-dependent sugar dehydrogenase [Actinobacteria bacterium]|nr:PQQ-dependent sugar dehydrogenase [Actinomycetota bacterium]
MFRRAVVASLVVAIVTTVAPTATALPRGTKVRTYKGNLSSPIDMAWVRGTKKIFFTEKNTGRVRVMKGRKLLSRPCVDLPVSNDGEQGALGITLHPRYRKNHYLYVYYTDSSPVVNRVARFTVRNNRCRNKKNIITLGAATIHNGGQLEFAGGKLYISIGEIGDPAHSQNTNNNLGKILRVNANGTIPKSNPFGNAVWSYGHRNPFGLAHKPGTSKVYETENGPQCDDEMNVIVKGRNYGWGPGYDCGTAGVGPNPKPPEVRWSRVIVPTDLGWYSGKLKGVRGLLGADYGDGRLHRFVLNDRGTRVKKDQIIYNAGTALFDVAHGPGGWLYFLTGNAIKRVVKR